MKRTDSDPFTPFGLKWHIFIDECDKIDCISHTLNIIGHDGVGSLTANKQHRKEEQREERKDILQQRMKELEIEEKDLWWYLETREFGTVPHSGFGLGLERLVQFVTGMKNIRDVIPFPRTPNNLEF